ncbi:MAG: PaaI family thioesterase [Acidobacteriota bacterium]
MPRRFPNYPDCPVCGDHEVNPVTLGVRWSWDDESQRVIGCFTPDRRHTGYAGRLHGGVLSALMDECLAWACAKERASFCITGELTMRFKLPALLGEEIALSGWVVTARGPYVRAAGETRGPDGRLIATAVGTFRALPREESEALAQSLRLAPGDVDILALTVDS